MKPILWMLVFVTAFSAFASPWNYDSASLDIKEYIVDCITNWVNISDIMLVQRRMDESLRNDEILGCCSAKLGMDEFRCVEVVKGDESVAGYKVVYLYRTPRALGEQSKTCYWISESGGSGYSVRENGRTRMLKGKEIWLYHPPYDPTTWFSSHEFVELRFVMPVRRLIKKHVCFGARYYIGNEERRIPGSKDLREEELMRMFESENIFSNRVYQSEEGCLFQVDYPVPELEWIDKLQTKEEHDRMVDVLREQEDGIMHLSPDEASEIVYLAYLADKRYTAADYDAASKRCPKLLKPVKEFKTEIGKRLKSAMEAGGMLPKK